LAENDRLLEQIKKLDGDQFDGVKNLAQDAANIKLKNFIEKLADSLVIDLNNMTNPPTAIPTERHKTPNLER